MEELKDKNAWRASAANVMTFRYLSSAELALVLKASTVYLFGPEETVVKEGELDPYFYGILEGSVSVSVHEKLDTGELNEVYMCTLGPGDVFGEAGIFLKVKRTATVRTLDDVVLLRLHRSDLAAFIKAQPSGGNKLLLVVIYGLLRKLRAANQELAYERKADMDQTDVDALLADMTGS
ncbi:MAG: cyclic nucleotide-binding domain-containing protein [Spirochaetales bacterium]|nr:MAG: cyclic nucleotide-binding domain-containing protein [Spirochaetales bacterium]